MDGEVVRTDAETNFEFIFEQQQQRMPKRKSSKIKENTAKSFHKPIQL